MDLSWGDERSEQFITNVGLITSDGPHGPNVMAAEWTFHISYSPGLIAIVLGSEKATYENIQEAREFGVNLASIEQSMIASVSGRYTGKEVRKIDLLKELGFRFYTAKRIRAPMVEGAAMGAECKLVKEISFGDHQMLVGEVLEASVSGKEPLAYHKGKYWRMDQNLERPSQEERERISRIAKKYRK